MAYLLERRARMETSHLQQSMEADIWYVNVNASFEFDKS